MPHVPRQVIESRIPIRLISKCKHIHSTMNCQLCIINLPVFSLPIALEVPKSFGEMVYKAYIKGFDSKR